MKLLIDYETRSRADLPAVGQHIYARHPDTEILCIGYKVIGESEAHLVSYSDIYLGEAKHFIKLCKSASLFVAHNAPFEQAITKHVLLKSALGPQLKGVDFSPEKWYCTAAAAATLALPRSLDKVSEALNLPHKKDGEGKKLMLQMCKPRRPIQDIKKWIEWVETDDALKRLYEYCKQDLWTEEALFNYLEQYSPFTKEERALWVLDQKINQRGFSIDKDAVTSALKIIREEETTLTKELQLKTFGLVKSAKQNKAMKDFLSDQGFDLPNLQKPTIDQAIIDAEKNGIRNKDVIDVLKIRQSLGKSSTSKYQAFFNRVDTDNRVRDNLMYHGASTGRWSGTGVQPQNFPRGTIKIDASDYNLLKSKDLEFIKVLYPRPIELLSSMLRGIIIASKDKDLFCADFSSIEARVLLWVANDKAGLKEYEEGVDPYKSMASVIYRIPISKVTPDQRQLGKQVILACGYQMGRKKFKQTCEQNKLNLPESLIERAHQAFRDKYPLVPQVWSNYEQAAIYAVNNPKKRITVNKVVWYMEKDFLFAKLPSGRRLAYYKPELKKEKTFWNDEKLSLYHWGVDSLSKKWTLSPTYGGKLTENIVQAISRDCMSNSMPILEAAGFEGLITVHDENLCEKEKGDLKEFVDIMSARPLWGKDIPLEVKGWQGPRYKK